VIAPAENGETIAFDFDGTLHPYTEGWVGETPADEWPINGAVELLHDLVQQGYRIVVFSCRADSPEGKLGIEQWLDKYFLGGMVSEVTHIKPQAIAYVDDRAVAFSGTYDSVRDDIERIAARPARRLSEPAEA
jgi:phosphoglycolate phosphatase-like HAD superfamily hydrolase